MRFRQPVLHASLDHAPSALLSCYVGEAILAARNLAYFDLSCLAPVPLSFHLALLLAFARAAVHPPELISVFVGLLLYASLADGADDDIQLVSIASDTAPMIVRPSMVSTVDFSAVLALKGHEVPLMALGQLTVLSYLCFKHI